jgi:hypothetical protein
MEVSSLFTDKKIGKYAGKRWEAYFRIFLSVNRLDPSIP